MTSKTKGKTAKPNGRKRVAPNTKGFVNEPNTVFRENISVAELARQTGYTPSYLARCKNLKRRPSLEAVQGIHLATGKSYDLILDAFWKDRPKTLKAHLALGEEGFGRGKHAGGQIKPRKGDRRAKADRRTKAKGKTAKARTAKKATKAAAAAATA